MDKRLIESRLRTLHDAITVLRALPSEMPAHKLRLESGERMLQRIAADYERQCNDLATLAAAERKPPMRVNPRGRRKASDVRSRELCPCNDPVCTRAHIKRDPPMDNSNVADENEG